MRKKKKAVEEARQEIEIKTHIATVSSVKIYRVVVSSVFTWSEYWFPLKVCFLREDAEKFIDSYPNPFIRPFLSISEEIVRIDETD